MHTQRTYIHTYIHTHTHTHTNTHKHTHTPTQHTHTHVHTRIHVYTYTTGAASGIESESLRSFGAICGHSLVSGAITLGTKAP